MTRTNPTPATGTGAIFLTEGGTETEIMYRHGFELPEFAMFPLLDNPKAVTAMRQVMSDMLDVAAEFGLSFMLTGLDCRASPDWGGKAGLFSRWSGRGQYRQHRVPA